MFLFLKLFFLHMLLPKKETAKHFLWVNILTTQLVTRLTWQFWWSCGVESSQLHPTFLGN